jgi:RimJ/RimL family protein N-acetyltransferase
MKELRTVRLHLRPFREDDLDALVELDSDPAVMFHINGGRPTSREELETDSLPAYLAYAQRPDGYGFWAAETGGEFAGWFHLRPRPEDPPDEPELGYRLRRRFWGTGLATEGSRALIDHAFSDLGAARVVAETMVVNTGSRRVMEKCGMRQIRVFHQEWPDRIPGDEQGDVEYAVTRAEWADAGR